MGKEKNRWTSAGRGAWLKFGIYTLLYLAFLVWVQSWWGLVVVPFIFDAYISRKIKWDWWKTWGNPIGRRVMAWVDALVFALVAVYFLNQFFFQNFVIPSSSLEKTLLTGDYLLVSKVAYGPRIPETPLSMPLMQHTMPVVGCKSYLEHPHWQYRRVDGLGKVKLGDIVVFNYPSGDTVALKAQDQDYYRLAYQLGAQIYEQMGSANPLLGLTTKSSFEKQQEVLGGVKRSGEQYMLQHPEMFGRIVARPTDRRENYVKRCVGMPGDWFEIRKDTIYLNGVAAPQPKEAQWNYYVTWRSLPTEAMMKEWGMTEEDLSMNVDGQKTYIVPLTAALYDQLKGDSTIVAHIERAESSGEWLYPQNMVKDWTTANYGPFRIPKKGDALALTLDNLPIYMRPIMAYEHHSLEVKEGKIYLDGVETDSWTPRYDYYWMMGDNRDNSADSRFWGFVPENHVVGKPLFVWLSLNKDYGWLDGKVRWNRFFKDVSSPEDTGW